MLTSDVNLIDKSNKNWSGVSGQLFFQALVQLEHDDDDDVDDDDNGDGDGDDDDDDDDDGDDDDDDDHDGDGDDDDDGDDNHDDDNLFHINLPLWIRNGNHASPSFCARDLHL